MNIGSWQVQRSTDLGDTWELWSFFYPYQRELAEMTAERLGRMYPEWSFRMEPSVKQASLVGDYLAE